jgi:nuclear transport factor 2 (NTF2) superfamily protein
MNTAQLQEFATRYTSAWCSHKPASVASFFSMQGSLQINDGTPAVGRAAIMESARAFMTDFPDLRVVMDYVVNAPDRIEYHWTLTGTHTSSRAGNKVRISGFEQWKFDQDGLIAVSIGHFDTAEYQRQITQTAEKAT